MQMLGVMAALAFLPFGVEQSLTSGPTLVPGDPATVTTVWTFKDRDGSPLVELTQVI